MARSADALIHPELLVWARESAGMDLEEAAQHINNITAEKLQSWESGESRPTVKQLRKVATVYKQSFAAFYLPEAPKVFRPPLKDYRLFPGDTATTISSEVALDSRLALDRREITLELYAERGEEVPRFTARTTLRKNLETLGGEIRKLLGVTNLRQ